MPGNTLTRTLCAGALWTVMVADALSQSANAPLSAIDWLSDSITLPDPVPPQAAMPSPSASAPEVLVAPLDAPAGQLLAQVFAQDERAFQRAQLLEVRLHLLAEVEEELPAGSPVANNPNAPRSLPIQTTSIDLRGRSSRSIPRRLGRCASRHQ